MGRNKYTVQFTVKAPTVTLLVYMSNPLGTHAIVPKEEVEKQGGTLTRPVGTGPYKFVEYVPDKHVIIERNKDYKGSNLPTSGTGTSCSKRPGSGRALTRAFMVAIAGLLGWGERAQTRAAGSRKSMRGPRVQVKREPHGMGIGRQIQAPMIVLDIGGPHPHGAGR